jgi:hypothetical protein
MMSSTNGRRNNGVDSCWRERFLGEGCKNVFHQVLRLLLKGRCSWSTEPKPSLLSWVHGSAAPAAHRVRGATSPYLLPRVILPARIRVAWVRIPFLVLARNETPLVYTQDWSNNPPNATGILCCLILRGLGRGSQRSTPFCWWARSSNPNLGMLYTLLHKKTWAIPEAWNILMSIYFTKKFNLNMYPSSKI